MASIDVMKASASNFGFDSEWVKEILIKYGPSILALAVEAARNGFSVNFIVEVLGKFGPTVLQLLLKIFNNNKTTKGLQSIDSSVIDVILEQYFPLIIEKYLPTIWAQFGPMIVQFIQNNLKEIIEKFGLQITKDNLLQIIQLILQLLKK